MQKVAEIVNRAKDPEKGECEVIQSTGARIGLSSGICYPHTVGCYAGCQKLSTKSLLATLAQILPPQMHVTQAHSSVTSRNLDITHTILM